MIRAFRSCPRQLLTLSAALLAVVVLVVLSASGLTGRASGTPPAPSAVRADPALEAGAREYAETFGARSVAVALLRPDGGVALGGHGAGAHTRFRVASLTKSFTAAAVMMLVEEGRLDLDSPVTRALPELRMADDRIERITLRRLLTHTSGLSARGFDEYRLPPATSHAEVVAQLHDVALSRDPGTGAEYLNTNYNVAARAVEVASGMDFDAFLADRIFTPLGMRDTTSTFRCEAPVDGLVRGHLPVAGLSIPAPEMPGACGGSGGIVSTAEDMARWLAFQLGDGTAPAGDRLLAAASLAELHTVQSGAGDSALGWVVEALDGDIRVGHTGSLTTYSSAMAFLPGSGSAAVVLTDAPGAPSQLLDAALTGEPGEFTDSMRVIDIGAAVLAALSLVASGLAAARARRWAGRHLPAARRVGGLAWPALMALLGVAGPVVAGASLGIVSIQSWVYLVWILPSAAALCLVWAIGGVTVLVCRSLALRATGRSRSESLVARSPGQPGAPRAIDCSTRADAPHRVR